MLDKCYKVWYNESTTGEGEATTKCGCPRERVRPLPDEPTARCVGLRYTNVNQCRFAEVMTDYAYYKATRGGGLLVFSLRPLLSLNCKRLGVCPPPMNGVECQRIHDIGERGFLLFPPFAPFYFQPSAHGPGARNFNYNTTPAICQ